MVHPIYSTLPTDPIHTVMAATATKLLVQRYPLTALSYAGKARPQSCPVCNVESETLTHFLLWCNHERSLKYVHEVQSLLAHKNFSFPTLNRDCTESQEWYTQLLLDPTALTSNCGLVETILQIARRMIYHLHHHRSVSLGGGVQIYLGTNG